MNIARIDYQTYDKRLVPQLKQSYQNTCKKAYIQKK